MEYTLYLWSTDVGTGIGACHSYNFIEDGSSTEYKFVGTFRSLAQLIYLLLEKLPDDYPTRDVALSTAVDLWDGVLCGDYVYYQRDYV